MGFRKSTNNYNLDHIHLPSIHPDPIKSIKITQAIVELLANNENNLFQDFQSKYSFLEIQDRYYLNLYSLEYFSFDYYETFIQNHFLKIEKEGEQNSIISYNSETHETISNPRTALLSLIKQVELKSEIDDIIEFIRDDFPVIERELKTLMRSKFHEIGDWSVGEDFYNSDERLNPNVYQINLNDNSQLFLAEVRKILNKISSHEVDTFIYNSFSFPENHKHLELCDLNFGNSTVTNRLIHSIYKTYNNIIKGKISRFDFAKIMYLNFQFVRDNWNEFSKTNKNVLRESYLKTHVASNIEK